MSSTPQLKAGDKVLVGSELVEVSSDFASQIEAGDVVLGVVATRDLKRISSATHSLVSECVDLAASAFAELATVSESAINKFFDEAANLLSTDSVFDEIARVNADDVSHARSKGRSTTRLVLSSKMRSDMVAAFRMWRDLELPREMLIDQVIHNGWTVEQWRSPLGVIGFVFEGRPNVFADATGVLKSGNSVVFRIGSDALDTARAIMECVIHPALAFAGLPRHSVVLVDSPEHAAGWALFSNKRIALAVARGSGPAVSELGSIAQQSGVSVSLHGTGGAWMIVGEQCDAKRFSAVVEYSLDRKVCNTLNTVCIVKSRAEELLPVLFDAAHRAGRSRGHSPRIHAVEGCHLHFAFPDHEIDVVREGQVAKEAQVSTASIDILGHEFEWEENPEFAVAVVDSVSEAVELFNRYSPQFVVSVISESAEEQAHVWSGANAPFVGDGMTRWVDGQFALLRPELGLSNWENGRLFARSGILSGDSAFTVRLRVKQSDSTLHR